MPYLEKRYWITYNGEIFNFLELRAELESLGERFYSDSDTEVIVAAYHRWGSDCVLRFNGMWAFAIWDSRERQLFLSRDRFGIKPLHYLDETNRFVFASELKAFLYLPGFNARENLAELYRGLVKRESQEETLLEGVKLLRPGHNMLVSSRERRIWRWWRTLDHLVDAPKRFEDQVERFRELFFDACRVRLRSDVPVATCLSGGMDSSSILCSLAALDTSNRSERFSRDFHRAFVATFAGTKQDEREYAEAAIEKSHATPHYRPMDISALAQDLEQYAYDFEMIGNALLLPIWAIYRELRRDGVYVSLDGHGGDELLAGYEGPLRHILRQHGSLLRAPLRTLDLVSTVRGLEGSGLEYETSFMWLLSQGDPFLRSLRETVGRARRSVSGARKAPTTGLRSGLVRVPASEPLVDMDQEETRAAGALSPINRDLYEMFHHGILQSILRKYDRLSMAHGVEVRMPFMDHRLVSFAFSLPDESKVGGGYTKRILREAMRGVLPEKVRTRKSKLGFLSPTQHWMNGALGDVAWERVNSARFLQCEYWDGPAVRDFIAPRHRARRWTSSDAIRIWPMIQADLWRESFFGARYTAASQRMAG